MPKPEVDFGAIIKIVMEEKGVDPRDIPGEKPFVLKEFFEDLKDANKKKSLRYYRGKLPGNFDCHKCMRSWHSEHTSCILDLKEQTLKMKLYQECKIDNTKAFPCYKNKDHVKRTVEWAVNLYLIKTNQLIPQVHVGGGGRRTTQHLQDNCEACQIMGRPCS